MGLLMTQQDSMRTTQLLIAINAAAVLLLLGVSGTWGSLLLATAMLGLLVYSVGAEVLLGRSRQAGLVGLSEGGLLRRSSVSAVGRGLEQSLACASLRPPVGAAAGVSMCVRGCVAWAGVSGSCVRGLIPRGRSRQCFCVRVSQRTPVGGS